MEGTKSVQRVRKREIITKDFAIGRKDVTIVLILSNVDTAKNHKGILLEVKIYFCVTTKSMPMYSREK
jgi:hypothetical protein